MYKTTNMSRYGVRIKAQIFITHVKNPLLRLRIYCHTENEIIIFLIKFFINLW